MIISKMKPNFSTKSHSALTLFEVLLVVATVAILAVISLTALVRISNRGDRGQPINCVNNLKQIGLAFREWALDNNDKFPTQVSVTNGGPMEFVMKGDVASVFRVMSNELNTPKILVCPFDTNRTWATNFGGSLHNSNISYFVSLTASSADFEILLSGDRNLTNGLPIRHGLLELPANRPAGWTREIHNKCGNVALADGSVRQLNNAKLNQWLQKCDAATNRLAIP